MGMKKIRVYFELSFLRRKPNIIFIVVGALLLLHLRFIAKKELLSIISHRDINYEINALRNKPLEDKPWDVLLVKHLSVLAGFGKALIQGSIGGGLPKIVLEKDFHLDVEEKRLRSYRNITEQDWDVLYSKKFEHSYSSFRDLKPHQLVNHIMHMGVITSKASLTSHKSGLSHIKPSFRIPAEREEFLKFASSNPNKKWLRKGMNHRGIFIFNSSHILALKHNKKIETPKGRGFNGIGYMLQEFLDNPYLVNNRKFDIGVHGLFTSTNPMRGYADFGDWNIKFCLQNYEPFDENNLERFIEGQQFKNTYEEETLAPLMAYKNFTRKEAFMDHFLKSGHNPSQLEGKIMDALIELGGVMDAPLYEATKNSHLPPTYRNRNFFEFVRFDFALDRDLKVWIIEANSGPVMNRLQVSATKPYTPPPPGASLEQMIVAMNQSLLVGSFYRNVMRSMFLLAGASHARKGIDETSFVSDSNINVDHEECLDESCTCFHWKCKVCWRCLDLEDKKEKSTDCD